MKKKMKKSLDTFININLASIPFNIWDDYYDDGCAPKGEIQQTHGCIEEFDELNEEQKEEIGSLVFNNLKKLDLPGVTLDIDGDEIYFKNLTHERREKLVDELRLLKLRYQNIPIEFYSES